MFIIGLGYKKRVAGELDCTSQAEAISAQPELSGRMSMRIVPMIGGIVSSRTTRVRWRGKT